MTLVNDELENSKKRKKGDPEFDVVSPKKNSKLDESCFSNEDNSTADNTQLDSQSTDSPSQESASSSQSGESSQDNTQHKDGEDSPKKFQSQLVLELREEDVFTKLLEAFSEENPPAKITYDGSSCNLTQVYNEFWATFYNSPSHSKGNETKLPQEQCLTNLQLKSLAKIIKRGWEDQRYWPKKLFSPLLETCLLGGLKTNLIWITPEMFMKYVENADKAFIQNQNNVDQNILNIFERYCPGITVSIGDDIKESCKTAAELMIVNMERTISIWSKELTGLMPITTLHFIMNESLNPEILQNIDLSLTEEFDDMEDYTPPHQIWQTFFRGWPEDKIIYYLKLLHNCRLGKKCNLCGSTGFNAKHFISSCEKSLQTTMLDRHDAVLGILDANLCSAIKNKNMPYLSMGSEWQIYCMYGNEFYQWPKEDLGVSFDNELYPHLMAYSILPKKRALIIEFSISWEHWVSLENENKSMKYMSVKEALEKNGFEVSYRVFVLGSRGVLVPELRSLLEEIIGLDYNTLSEVLQEISQTIIHIPYLKYKELMEST